MYVVVLAALLGCKDNSRCYGYCADLKSVYPQIVENAQADTAGLPGYGGGDSFDEAAYLDTCGDAPSGRDCETCSGWWSEVFIEPAGITDSCDEVYERADTEPSEEIYQQMLDECRESCEVHGLTFEN